MRLAFISRLITDVTVAREMKLHFNTAARQDNSVRFHFTVDRRRAPVKLNYTSTRLRDRITWLDFISRLIADATIAREMKLHFTTAARHLRLCEYETNAPQAKI